MIGNTLISKSQYIQLSLVFIRQRGNSLPCGIHRKRLPSVLTVNFLYLKRNSATGLVTYMRKDLHLYQDRTSVCLMTGTWGYVEIHLSDIFSEA